MRKKILKYKEITGRIPEVGIMFCGNRAVVTSRYGSGAFFHTDVYFGLLFWTRLKWACRKVYKKEVNSPNQ